MVIFIKLFIYGQENSIPTDYSMLVDVIAVTLSRLGLRLISKLKTEYTILNEILVVLWIVNLV